MVWFTVITLLAEVVITAIIGIVAYRSSEKERIEISKKYYTTLMFTMKHLSLEDRKELEAELKGE